MGYLVDFAAAADVVTGLLMLGLALFLLWLDWRRSSNLIFALFLIANGLAIALPNLGEMATDDATAALWFRAWVYYFALTSPLLAYFTAVFPRPLGSARVRAALATVLFTPSLVLLGAYTLRPAPFVGALERDALGYATVQGTVTFMVFWLWLAALTGLAVLRLLVLYLRPASAREEGSTRLLLMALAGDALFWVIGVSLNGLEAGTFGQRVTPETAPLWAGISVVNVLVAGTVLACVLVVWLRTRDAVPRRRHGLVLAYFGLLAPLLLVDLFVGEMDPRFNTRWFFRALIPALVLYAVLKHQLFDIDLRIKWTIRRGTLAAVFVGVFFVVANLAQNLLSESLGWAVGGVVAGLLLFGIAPLQRFAERVANTAMPNVTGTSEYLAFKKLEVYRAALESAMRDGSVTSDERAILERLKETLGLRAEDAAALERDARDQWNARRPARRGPAAR